MVLAFNGYLDHDWHTVRLTYAAERSESAWRAVVLMRVRESLWRIAYLFRFGPHEEATRDESSPQYARLHMWSSFSIRCAWRFPKSVLLRILLRSSSVHYRRGLELLKPCEHDWRIQEAVARGNRKSASNFTYSDHLGCNLDLVWFYEEGECRLMSRPLFGSLQTATDDCERSEPAAAGIGEPLNQCSCRRPGALCFVAFKHDIRRPRLRERSFQIFGNTT